MKKSLTIIATAAVLFANQSFAQILIGQTAGVTGQAAGALKENLYGAKLYIDHVNATGGVQGQKIELITLDDEYLPKKSAENAEKLITENKVVAMFMTKGTPHTEAVLPVLAKHQIALVGPSTGAMVLHNPVNPYVFNVRSSYRLEANKLVHHLNTTTVNRIAVAYVDDSFGKDAVIGVQEGMGELQLKPTVLIPVNRDKPDYKDAISRLNGSNSQTVIWIGSLGNVANGIKALRDSGSSMQVVTLSNLASGAFVKELGKYASGIVVSQVFPNENSIRSPLVEEASKLAKLNKSAPITGTALEGYASAKVLVEAIRRASPNPSKEKILKELSKLRYDLGGFEINYSDKSHTGMKFSDLSIINYNGKFIR